MTTHPDDAAAARERQRQLVRRGYDSISLAYRSDEGQPNAAGPESTSVYESWLQELAGHLTSGARLLDLGCGAGVPADRWLTAAGFNVTGVDISPLQIDRARQLVPGATFLCDDMATFDVAAGSFDAVISFYALIHVPLDDQRHLFPRIRRWLRPGGFLLAIVGHDRWTGVEDYMGTPMFWDHADTATYLEWLEGDDIHPLWHRYVAEGASGHTLVLAQRR